MEYRCEWCGERYPTDDPPCEECGHGEFEEALLREDGTVETTELMWVCANCGRAHQRNNPPCKRCGGTDLEPHEQDYDDLSDAVAPSYGDLASPAYLAAVAVALLVFGLLVLVFAGVV